jgi:hypothetical protein
MIKCGDELEGKPQCILYSKDGSKALGRFPYSEHGGEKGAKAAAHKREGQIQFFKQQHRGLLEAIEAFGAPTVLKYLLETDCPDCQQVVKAHVAEWLEKAEAETGEEVEKKKKLPYGGSLSQMWSKKFGGSVEKCMAMVKGKVSDPGAYCAKLKDKALKRTTWRGKGKHEKSFEETIEEALTILQKDEDEEMDIDLKELEALLSGEESADVEPEPTEDAEPEPEGDVEPEPTEPEPESVEERELDFRTFLLREHGQRRANILAMLGEEVEDG